MPGPEAVASPPEEVYVGKAVEEVAAPTAKGLDVVAPAEGPAAPEATEVAALPAQEMPRATTPGGTDRASFNMDDTSKAGPPAFPPGRIQRGLVLSPDSDATVSRPVTPGLTTESSPTHQPPKPRASVTFAEDPAAQSRRPLGPMPLVVDGRSVRPGEEVSAQTAQAPEQSKEQSAPSFWPASRDALMAALGKTWPPTSAGGGKTCVGPACSPAKLPRSPRSAMGEVYLQGASMQQWHPGEGTESTAVSGESHEAPELAAAEVLDAADGSGAALTEALALAAAPQTAAEGGPESGQTSSSLNHLRKLVPPDSSSSRAESGRTRPESGRTRPESGRADSGRTGNEGAAAVKEAKKRPWPRPPPRPPRTKAPPPGGGALLPSLLRFGHKGIKPVTPPPTFANFQWPHDRVKGEREADPLAEAVMKDLAQECKAECEAAVRREEEGCKDVLPRFGTQEVALQTDAASMRQWTAQAEAEVEAPREPLAANASNRQVVFKRCDWRHVELPYWTKIRPPEQVLSEEMRYTFHVHHRFPGALDRVVRPPSPKPTLQFRARNKGPSNKWSV